VVAGTQVINTRMPVVGTPISAVSSDDVLDLLDNRPLDRGTVVAFCNVHSVMTARRDPAVAAALSCADVAAPDGMPVVWGLRAMGLPSQTRVDGPTFLRQALEHGVARGWSHYFYGSTEDTLERLLKSVKESLPDVEIAGVFSPPFGPPTEEDIHRATSLIRDSGADLVWVGLGMPKQELWMQRIQPLLPGVALLGVGAAFDFVAGTIQRAPYWMQATGLEWVYRLLQEPRRLWRRYLYNNPAFLVLLAKDIASNRLRREPLVP